MGRLQRSIERNKLEIDIAIFSLQAIDLTSEPSCLHNDRRGFCEKHESISKCSRSAFKFLTNNFGIH